MEFDLQPTLRGKLVELRPLRPTDFAGLYAVASDPLVWEQHPEPDRYKRDVFQLFFDAAMESGSAFATLDLKSGRVIGSTRYYNLDAEQRVIGIGYTFIGRAFWGAGYNPEAKKLMLDHAFQFVDRVFFEVGQTNLRSRKAMANIGARVLSTMQLPARDGTLQPYLLFGIDRLP